MSASKNKNAYSSTVKLIRDRYAVLSEPPKEKDRFRINMFKSNTAAAKSSITLKSGGSILSDNVYEPPKKIRKSKKDKEGEVIRPNPMFESTPTNKLAHQLRLAVHLGNGSIDPEENPQLRNILREIWELGMPQEEVHRILRQCTLCSNKLNSYKLQIRYRKNVFLILCVQVGQLLKVKKKLMPILKEFKASFHYAMDMFQNIGLIEAYIKPATLFDFEDFDSIVRRDAWGCKAKALEVIDYSTGSVCFSCNPLQLLHVATCLKSKGYEVVYSENGYRANLLVDLNWLERSTYTKFVAKLYGIDEITHIYDNVRSAEVSYDPVLNFK